MADVTTIRPEIASIHAPNWLADEPGWLIWRYEQVDGEKKPRKVPYYTDGGRRAGVQGGHADVARLTTLAAAKAAAARRGFNGVGFATLPQFPIAALDFDHCLDDGEPMPAVLDVIAGTYAEFSPSGTGVRAFVEDPDCELANHKDNAGPFGFETFRTKGFVTFTGHVLPITAMAGDEKTLGPVTDALRALCNARFIKKPLVYEGDGSLALMAYEPRIGLSLRQLRDALEVFPDNLPYESSVGPSWLGVGMAIHHETDGSDAGFELWDQWSARSPKYSSSEYSWSKWRSFGRGGQSPMTARSLIKWVKDHGGHLAMDANGVEDFTEAAAVPDSDTKLRFPVVSASDFSQGAPPAWMIKHVLPRSELVVLFGEAGSGKSFLAVDMAMAIARGEPWRERKTKHGRVVYIAAEGGGGFRSRLQAYALHHQVELGPIPFGVIHAAPNFMERVDALDVCRAIQASGGADLVVVDTFAQVTPGANENAGEHVGKALAHCKGIHTATGATVLLVHHAGKDSSKGARGWSGLRAAADAEIEVVRTPSGARMARVTKQKDGDDQGAWGFALNTVPVGMDEDGDVIDSCVVVEDELPVMGGPAPRKLGKWQQRVMDVVLEFAGAQLAGIEVDAVLEESIRRETFDPNDKEARKNVRRQARRALNALLEMDDMPFFKEDDNTLTIVEGEF